MQFSWIYTRSHWSDLPALDRENFYTVTKPILDTGCVQHGTDRVYTSGHTHYCLYYLRKCYWEFIFSCDEKSQRVYIWKLQYCDKSKAERIVRGETSTIALIIAQLERIEARQDQLRYRAN